MKYAVFVDGQEGTTGLEINQRLDNRDDVEIIKIDPNKRKDVDERSRCLNQADIVFLCLPDEAARESVSLVTNPSTCIIDGSTAHRTLDDWAYGIPELSKNHRTKIMNSRRVTVPGCHATGFNMIIYPLVSQGFLSPDYHASFTSITGHSGGGRRLIETYQSPEEKEYLNSPCFYALGLQHKHIPEMQKHSGLNKPPIFTPIVNNYYRGMTAAVSIHPEHMSRKSKALDIHSFYDEYFKGQPFVKVMPYGVQNDIKLGFLNAEGCNFTNLLELYIFGDDNQILVIARFDNLGKGASGAAIQNLNLMMGKDETYALI